MPGLYLVVQRSGAKSWGDPLSPSRRDTETHPRVPNRGIDLKHARLLAAKALRMIAEGRDPGREKARLREADSAAASIISSHPQKLASYHVGKSLFHLPKLPNSEPKEK